MFFQCFLLFFFSLHFSPPCGSGFSLAGSFLRDLTRRKFGGERTAWAGDDSERILILFCQQRAGAGLLGRWGLQNSRGVDTTTTGPTLHRRASKAHLAGQQHSSYLTAKVNRTRETGVIFITLCSLGVIIVYMGLAFFSTRLFACSHETIVLIGIHKWRYNSPRSTPPSLSLSLSLSVAVGGGERENGFNLIISSQ